MPEIIPLNPELIHRANSNSFGGGRGDNSNALYFACGQEILNFPIADSRKEKLLQELYNRYSVILNYEAQHVSVVVAGPANYNAKRLDKGEQVLKAHHDFSMWFDGIREQVKCSAMPSDKTEGLLKEIELCDRKPELDPTYKLMQLAFADNAKFIELFEKLVAKYRWRKNSSIYKLYLSSKAGEVQEIRKEVVYEDENFTAYKERDRYYIKFVLRPKQQLHVALKSRGWWWNSRAGAYSTYIERFNLEWVKSISERYSAYV